MGAGPLPEAVPAGAGGARLLGRFPRGGAGGGSAACLLAATGAAAGYGGAMIRREGKESRALPCLQRRAPRPAALNKCLPCRYRHRDRTRCPVLLPGSSYPLSLPPSSPPAGQPWPCAPPRLRLEDQVVGDILMPLWLRAGCYGMLCLQHPWVLWGGWVLGVWALRGRICKWDWYF